jgi:hypothetical protein
MMFEKIYNIFSKENIIDIFAILISIYNIYFIVKQERKIKIIEVNNYWFRNYVRNFIIIVKDETNSLLNSSNKDYFEFLMSLKKSFSKIRDNLWEISFFDEKFYNTLFNFINEYEQEFSNTEMSPNKEDIMKIQQIIMKSILTYERNNYTDFTIIHSF